VPFWRRKKLQQKRLFDKLVLRLSLYQLLVRNLNRVGDFDLRHVAVRPVLQQPTVDELIIRSPVMLRVGFIERLERPGNPACHLKCVFRRVDGYVPVFDGTILLLPHIT
jgi:hypothetical protein